MPLEKPTRSNYVVTLDEGTVDTLREVLDLLQEDQHKMKSSYARQARKGRHFLERHPPVGEECDYKTALDKMIVTIQKLVGYPIERNRWEEPKGFFSKREASQALDFLTADNDSEYDGSNRVVLGSGSAKVTPWGIIKKLADEKGSPIPLRLDGADLNLCDIAITLADELEQGGGYGGPGGKK